jgi:cobalt/nickel transport system ATP-binding protein
VTKLQSLKLEHVCAPGGDELIHVDCASHKYPDGSIGIHEMCFRVMKNEVVALCGPNGSGKSTLIEHLNGLLKPNSGRVTVLGKAVSTAQGDIWKEVGLVFQKSDDQLFAPTVLDDVMFGPINMGMEIEEARSVALEALRALGAEPLATKVPSYLSGGQKRLVSIAGVLAMKPKVIAMDEPTSDLDPNHSDLIEKIILDLKKTHGISVVVATHDMDMAARLADRICIVKDGSIIAEGLPSEIFYDHHLLGEAGLKQPGVARIYESLGPILGLDPGRRPLNADELVRLVSAVANRPLAKD